MGKIDLSEYTLVSFGDSFTFGQGLFSDENRDADAGFTEYKKKCNSLSYTNIIYNKLNFKKEINLGLPASSNEYTMIALETFLRTHKDENLFLLINITDFARSLYTEPCPNNNKKFALRNMSYSLLKNRIAINDLHEYAYIKDPTFLDDLYTYYLSFETCVVKHIKFIRDIENTLIRYSKPYVVFDILNTLDKSIIKDNILDRFKNNSFPLLKGASDDFDQGHFIKSYNDEVVNDNRTLKNYMDTNWFSKLNLEKDISNIRDYMLYYTKYVYKDERIYSEYEKHIPITGRHWSTIGHKMFSDLLIEFMNEKGII